MLFPLHGYKYIYLHVYRRIGNFCGHEIFPMFMVELILRKYYFHSYTHTCGSHIPSVCENLIHDCNSTSKSFLTVKIVSTCFLQDVTDASKGYLKDDRIILRAHIAKSK